MVRDLLREENLEWNTVLVKEMFLPQDAEAILSIPISETRARDRMVWAGDKKGNFTVRSAYRLACDIEAEGSNSSCSDPSMMQGVWRGVWSLNVPNKIKHFVWKACNGILPTKESLYRRKITESKICEACGGRTETTMHALCFCNRGTEAWKESKLALPCNIQESWSFVDTFCSLRTGWMAQPGLLERWVSICWGIWKSRNEVRVGGKRQPSRVIVRSALKVLDDFLTVSEKPRRQRLESQPNAAWKPPLPGSFKVNVNGALFSKTKQAGVGVIARNEGGVVVATISRKLDYPLGALAIEVKALEIGVTFAEEVGLRDVVFEGDSQLVFNAVNGIGEAKVSVLNIIHGVLRKVQCFRTFDFLHTKRQGNAPAHLLA